MDQGPRLMTDLYPGSPLVAFILPLLESCQKMFTIGLIRFQTSSSDELATRRRESERLATCLEQSRLLML